MYPNIALSPVLLLASTQATDSYVSSLSGRVLRAKQIGDEAEVKGNAGNKMTE